MKNKSKLLTSLALSLAALGGASVITACSGGEEDISFKVNFYTLENTKYETIEATNGNVVVPSNNPTRNGYAFTGWYSDLAATTPFDANAKVTANTNVYAGWHLLPTAPSTLGYDKKTSVVYFNINDASYTYEMNLTRNGEVVDTSGAVKGSNKYTFEVVTPGDYEFYVVSVDSANYKSGNSKTISFSIEEAEFTVKFYDDSTLLNSVKLDANHNLTLPANPTKANAKFEGWYLDSTYRTALNAENAGTQLGFDFTSLQNQEKAVYAKWTYKPEAPQAPSVSYTSAKASGEQKLTIIDTKNTENVKGYSLTIVAPDGQIVEGYNNKEVLKDNKVIVLDSTKFEEGSNYIVYVKTISSLLWEDENITSVEKETNFTYSVVPQDVYTIHYMDGSTSLRDVNHTEGSTVVLPQEPTKAGYSFVRWELNGVEFNTSSSVTSTITVQAVWKKAPTAPTAYYVTAKIGQDQYIQWTDSTENVSVYRVTIKDSNGNSVQTTQTEANEVKLQGTYVVNSTYTVEIVTVLNEQFEGEDIVSAPTSSLFKYTETALDKVEVKFLSEGSLVSNIYVDEGTSVSSLPSNPSKAGYKFVKWVLEGTTTEFTTSTVINETTTVVAIFAEDPKSPEVTFNSAKANANPTLSWEAALGNVDHYIIVVKAVPSGAVIQEFTNVTDLTVELDRTLYTSGNTYCVETKTVLESGTSSDVAGSSFEYSVKPYDTFNAFFYLESEDVTPWETKSVKEQGTIVPPTSNPTKTGYVFSKWVLENSNELSTATITGDVNCYAVWTKLPDAPASVTYTDATVSLSWAAVEGCSEYAYKIDNGSWQYTTSTSVDVFGLEAGAHTVTMKVTVGELTSEEKVNNFTVTDLYVAKVVNGSVVGYVKVVDGKIAEQGAPEGLTSAQTFIKWTYDGKTGSSAVSFTNDEFDTSTKIYAIIVEKPAGVTAASIIYDEDSDTIKWDAVENAISYKVTFRASDATPFTTTNNSFVANITSNGNYYIKIETTVNVPGVGTTKATTTIVQALHVELTTKTTYSADGSLIKVVTGENTTYVYFAGQTYSMTGATFANSSFYNKLSDSVITMTTDSDLINQVQTMTYTDANGVVQTRNFKVVPQVLGVDVDGGYDNYLTRTSSSDTTFLYHEDTYKVGTATGTNRFVVDLDFSYGTGASFNSSDVELDVTFTLNGVETNNISLTKVDDHYEVVFDKVYTSGTLVMKVSPRYVNKDNYDATNQKVKDAMVKTFTFELNNGVNAYTTQQLKDYYRNTNIDCINILSGTIEATLDENQINADGSPVNFSHQEKYSQVYTAAQNTSGAPSAWENRGEKVEAHVFGRYISGTQHSSFTVNGNYATIDGSKLPFINGANAVSGVYSDQCTYNPAVPGYTVQSVNVGIFGLVETSGQADAHVQLNDLNIIGNGGFEGSDELSIAKYSGSYNGIRTLHANADTRNVAVSGTTISLYPTCADRELNNYSYNEYFKSENAWANSFFTWGTTHVTFLKSYFGKSSGAAIDIEDHGYHNLDSHATPIYDTLTEEERKTTTRQDPGLTLDAETLIDNWTDGAGAYFKAYGFASAIASLKVNLEAGVNQFGKTIIRKSPEDELVTELNLTFLFRPTNASSSMELTRIKTDGTKVYSAVTGDHSNIDSSNDSCTAGFEHLRQDELSDTTAWNYLNSSLMNSATVLTYQSEYMNKIGQDFFNQMTKFATDYAYEFGNQIGTELGKGNYPYDLSTVGNNATAAMVASTNEAYSMLNTYDRYIITGAIQGAFESNVPNNLTSAEAINSAIGAAAPTIISSALGQLIPAYAYQLGSLLISGGVPEAVLAGSSYSKFAPLAGSQNIINVFLEPGATMAGTGLSANSLFWAMLEFNDLTA